MAHLALNGAQVNALLNQMRAIAEAESVDGNAFMNTATFDDDLE